MRRPACAILLFLAAAAFAQEIEFEDEDGLSLDEAGEGIFLFAEDNSFDFILYLVLSYFWDLLIRKNDW